MKDWKYIGKFKVIISLQEYKINERLDRIIYPPQWFTISNKSDIISL